MSEYSVQKFGGTSAAAPEEIAEIFTEFPDRNKIAVLSAIGKDRTDKNSQLKITDALIGLEEAVDHDDLAATTEAQDFIIERTRQVYSMLGETSLRSICDDLYGMLQPKHRSEGYSWIGERISAKLFAQLTGAVYVPTDLRFSNGILDIDASVQAILKTSQPIINQGRQIVTEGFFGHDIVNRKIVTLPRGGSDTSGIIYAGAFGVAEPHLWINENYTDRDGIYSADPDVVDDARVIPEATHEEIREKMHGITERNGPVHGDAIAYASRMGVEMVVKNTFNPSASGTRIVSSRVSDPEHPIIGITGKSDITALSVFDMGMADAKNYLARILQKTGELDTSISNIPTGEDRIKLIFNSGMSEDTLEEIKSFIQEMAISGEKAEVEVIRNQGAVYIVGQELTIPITYTKTLGQVATILANEGLAMREIISHEKSPSLALTVEGSEVTNLIRTLHKALIEAT